MDDLLLKRYMSRSTPGIDAQAGNLSMYESHGSDNDSDYSDEVLVIGIDFGTTFSGVAWATTEDFLAEEIQVITSWPDYGREEGKAPTELFYEHGKVMWGYGIPPDAEPISWFKLLIVKDSDLSDEIRSSEFLLRGRKMLRENNKTAIDLIADYLRELWAHVIDTIKKSRGDSVVDALPFRVVLTVPAIWKSYAREAMEKAAKQSGILDARTAGPTTLTFAPEPEAAALSSLSERGRKTKAGEVYVVCDAGGGTVDLITYEIDSPQRPISVHEAVEGTGGLCGGIFIDQEFEYMCKARLGRKWDLLSKAAIKQIMKTEWAVGAKSEFRPSNKKDYIIAIPAEAFVAGGLDDDSIEPLIKNGRIHFQSKHIQKAFAKSFSDIQILINEQIKKAQSQGSQTTGIILVGGLGGSPYLYEVLKSTYGQNGINILQATGMNPRTAICRGAVYKGFMEGIGGRIDPGQPSMISVTSTVSRLSFGARKVEPFEPGKHLECDKYWDTTETIWRAKDQIDWYLQRGENVSKKDPVKLPYYHSYSNESDFSGTSSVSFVQCEILGPPSRITTDVTKLCTVNFRTDAKFSSLEEDVNSDGLKYRKLSFDVEMRPSGASVEFIIYVNGKRQGSQNVSVKVQ